MFGRKLWISVGGGMCLTAALVAQRVWGQPPALPALPSLPPPPIINSADPGSPPPPNIPLPPPAGLNPSAPTALPLIAPPVQVNSALPPMQVNSTSLRTPEQGVPENRPGKQEPTVSIEWVAPPNARYNQPIACQILVRNNGGSPVHQVVVKPNLPEQVNVKLSDPPLDPSNNDWNLGTLQPGQSRKIDVTLLSQRRGYQNYTAHVTFAADSVHLTEVREPLLQLKAKSVDKVMVGEPTPITFTLHNPGDGITENIKIRAVLPEGLDHPRGQAFEIEVGNLAPKETRTLQLACIAKGPGKMKASLIASADGGLSAAESCEMEILMPRLDLALQGPKLRFVERPARYTLKVTNPGNAPAQNVILNELVPAGFKFQSASAQGRYDEASRTVSWSLGELPAGQNREITLDLIPTVPGDHRLAAAVESTRGVRSESNVTTRVEGLSNLVLDVANADNPVEVGADATYEIRVANGGTKAETNLELSCSLPDAVEFRDARSAANTKFRVEGREVIFEPIGRLAPRAEVIFRVTVKGRLPGDVRFRARLRADNMTDVIQREEMTKFYDDNAVR